MSCGTGECGCGCEEFLELTIKELCLPEHVLRLLDSLDEVHYARPDEGPRKPVVWRHRRKDDTCFDVELTACPVTWNKCHAELVLGRNVTETLCAERRSTLFARLVERLNVTTTFGHAGQIIVGAAEDLFGWDACLLYLYDAARDQAQSIIAMDIVNGAKTNVAVSSSNAKPSPCCGTCCKRENSWSCVRRST